MSKTWEYWKRQAKDKSYPVEERLLSWEQAYNHLENALAATRAAVKEALPPIPAEDALCHAGICSQDKCAYCQRIIRAHQALAKASDCAEVRFWGARCRIVFALYGNGRLAMTLQGPYGERLGVATVNIPDAQLGQDETLIKNWGQNEGLLQVLIDAGVVEDTGRVIVTGHVQANVCKLLIKPE